MIRIGFHECATCNDSDTTRIIVDKGGKLLFEGTAHIGHGSKILVRRNAILELGDSFAISASSTINCYKHIKFGKHIQFSWDCLVMDNDTHSIIDENGCTTNPNKEIIVGDKVWIGCGCLILKGAIVPDHCVIGANSTVVGRNLESHTVIVGNPAKSIKKIFDFRI